MPSIQITAHGPYQVSQDVKLYREVIAKNDQGVLEAKRLGEIDVTPYLQNGFYYLCRCGQSQHAPFCDNSHTAAKFKGREVADRQDYADRAQVVDRGPELTLLDDNRCAFARFCHRELGEVWTLTDQSADPEKYRQAIEGSMNCPSGRLTHLDAKGKALEKEYEPQIAIIEDPLEGVSAGLFVRGYVQIIAADGFKYELRNRYALCRCGQSRNLPFCDATHVNVDYHAVEGKD